jgi:hypothetical protein
MADADSPERPDSFVSHTPVRARVLVEPGLGALWGFAAGAAAVGRGDDVATSCAVAHILMQRGMYHGTDTADGVAAFARVLPIALFHAGADEQRRETVLRQTHDLPTQLACVAWAGALAAAVWRKAEPHDQLIAAINDMDIVSELLRDAPEHANDETWEDAVIAANTGARAAFAEALEASFAPGDSSAISALSQAFWHILHAPIPDLDALASCGAAAPAVGALVGATRGLDALPPTWMDAGRAVGGADLADLVQTGPFLGWGIPKHTR